MKLKDHAKDTSLTSFKVRIPDKHKLKALSVGLNMMEVHICTWSMGVWVKTDMTSERVYPLTGITMHEVLEWEVVLKPKKIVCDLLGYQKGVSVRRGRGTSQNWIYIETPKKVAHEMRDTVEKKLLDLGLVGTFLSDQPGVGIRNTNVSWGSTND